MKYYFFILEDGHSIGLNYFEDDIAVDIKYKEITKNTYDSILTSSLEPYYNNEIKYKPNTNRKFIKKIFNYKNDCYEEGATLEEQIEYYKKLIIQKTKEIEAEKLAGFGNPNLELELNELKKIHLEKSHELGLQIENRLKEVSL